MICQKKVCRKDLSAQAPVFVRSVSHQPLEHPAHVLRVLEAQAVGNLAHGLGGGKQQFLRFFNHLSLNVFRSRPSRLLADHVAEIVG